MKLLFDQNLSFKLCRQLNDLFPDSRQVWLVGLEPAGISTTAGLPLCVRGKSAYLCT